MQSFWGAASRVASFRASILQKGPVCSSRGHMLGLLARGCSGGWPEARGPAQSGVVTACWQGPLGDCQAEAGPLCACACAPAQRACPHGGAKAALKARARECARAHGLCRPFQSRALRCAVRVGGMCACRTWRCLGGSMWQYARAHLQLG